jgi:hypothetical protein
LTGLAKWWAQRVNHIGAHPGDRTYRQKAQSNG